MVGEAGGREFRNHGTTVWREVGCVAVSDYGVCVAIGETSGGTLPPFDDQSKSGNERNAEKDCCDAYGIIDEVRMLAVDLHGAGGRTDMLEMAYRGRR